MIYTVALISLILIIWFNTEAFVEYCNVLRINLLWTKDYLNKKNNDVSLTYHAYLLYYHNSFFVRLITCPICFSFWVSLFICIFTNITFYKFSLVVILSLFVYFMFDKISS